MKKTIFEQFKRQRLHEAKHSLVKDIRFRLGFDDYGTYVSVVDKKGKEVEVSYLSYSGATRNLLRSLEQIADKSSFVIDWEKQSDRVYLSDYEFLLPILSRTGRVVDSNSTPIQFSKEGAGIRFVVQHIGGGKGWESKVLLRTDAGDITDFRLLNEEAVLADNTVFNIAPLGGNSPQLPSFNTSVGEDDLPIFLSILFSYMENVNLDMGDYKVEMQEESVVAEPSLIFEKVDEDESLLMRVGQVLPHLSVNVLEQFDLYYHADINEATQTVSVRPIEQAPLYQVKKEVAKLIKKHEGSKSDGTQAMMEEDLFILPREIAAKFIYNELPKLLSSYRIFGAEKLKSYKIKAANPTLNVSLSHGIDFLEGDVALDFDGEQLDLFQVLSQLRKQNYVKLADGTHALVNQDYIKKLERIFRKDKNGKTKVSFFDLPLVKELIDEKIFDTEFKKSREIFEGFNKIKNKKYKLPKIKAELRPYQKDGFKWMKYLMDNQLGGCLADDMGLGKTIQTLAILATVYPKEKKPSLIVMPRSLLFNWQKEAARFTPKIKTHIHYGTTRKWADAKGANLVFTTYATMRNDIKELKDVGFFAVVLDESQNIKNIEAQTTKAAMLLQAKHRLALSGTPLENNLSELYSLFRFLNPSMFGTVSQFNNDYLAPIQKYNDKLALAQLRKKIYPFILRRLKKDVLNDLPDKTEQTLFVQMSDAQRELYEKRRAFYQAVIKEQVAVKGVAAARFFIFQALNELRQIATLPENKSDGRIQSPKLELVRERLVETVSNGRKALVFVNFLAGVELISQQLDELGVDYVSMTGATRNRQALVDKFQNDKDCKVFVMTLKTGGTGLNLTAADTIFIFDPWWNVAAENQAIDRAHRIGQTNKVIAYKLITEGSIEEKIMQLQEVKKELFDNIISADGGALKSLSEEDIDFMLS